MPDYVWRPIEPLSDAERRIDLAAMGALYENWRASKKRIQQSSNTQLADFNQRLIRRLSVETGILERLYDLDRGTTEALVVHGFAEELVTGSNWASSYVDDDPIIVASWIDHRFTQIHPYQDGNGRVARTLATMVLLRADLLPLVIERDLRVEYINALESADLGQLSALAVIFARLERNAILQALSVQADTEISHQGTLTDAVVSALADKFAKRNEQKFAELRT